jgi:hypothetical protein
VAGSELAVETPDHPGPAVGGIQQCGDHLDGRSLPSDVSAIHTDTAKAWGATLRRQLASHKVAHQNEEWDRGNVQPNTVEGVWSLLKRSIVGTYHQLSAKHLPAYLDEIAFRFNNRENPWLFRDTVLRLLDEEPLRYKKLVHG